MGRARIRLQDQDRPGEFMEAEVVTEGREEMLLAVPNTIVEFWLRRRGEVFQGSLGGRTFAYSLARKPAKGRS